MSLRPLLRLAVEPVDVFLELLLADPPHAAAPDLDGRQLPRPDQRVDLGDADVEVPSHVLEGEESRLDGRRTLRVGRRSCSSFCVRHGDVLGPLGHERRIPTARRVAGIYACLARFEGRTATGRGR